MKKYKNLTWMMAKLWSENLWDYIWFKSNNYLKSFKTSKTAQILLNLKIIFSVIANFTWVYNEFYQPVQSCRISCLIFGETKTQFQIWPPLCNYLKQDTIWSPKKCQAWNPLKVFLSLSNPSCQKISRNVNSVILLQLY